MRYKKFDQMNCSLAQTLDVIGERWTLLILRDAFLGSRRFGQFQENLGVARNVLTTRLSQLVDEGVMERRMPGGRGHPEYVLTEKGLDLQPILLAMTHWGDAHKPHPKGDRMVFVDRRNSRPIQRMAVIAQDGRPLTAKEVKAVPGPGLAAD